MLPFSFDLILILLDFRRCSTKRETQGQGQVPWVIGLALQTRPPGTEVKSADLAQSALERAQKVFAEIETKVGTGKRGLYERGLSVEESLESLESLHSLESLDSMKTGATWGCTGTNLVCTGASDFWKTLGPSGQKTFCNSGGCQKPQSLTPCVPANSP